MRGKFITFEGADGSGKTTQIEKIKEYLEKQGHKCLLTREPGGSDLGNKIREILLHYEGDVDSLSELLLYMADRAQHVQKIIIPALEEGQYVLCDRYTDSSVSYQGYARGLDIERIIKLNEIATNGLEPDLTIVFDVETETAIKRVGEIKDRLEQEGIEFHKKLRYGYLELAKRFPERIKTVNANLSIDEVFEQVKDLIDKQDNISQAQKFFELANDFAQKDDNQIALEYYSKAIELNPDKADFYLGRGLLNAKLSVWTNAIFFLQKAIDMGIEDNPECYFQLGKAKFYTRDYSGASSAFGKAGFLDKTYYEKERDITKNCIEYEK